MSLTLLGAGNAGGSGYSPLTALTGVIGWWDTSVTASITLSGSNVTALADQSGVGNNLGNGGLGRTLPYSATGFNTSYPGIVATGGNGFLETPGAFAMGTGNTLTCWYVGTTLTGSSSTRGRILSYTHGGNLDWDAATRWCVTHNGTTTGVFFTRNGASSTTVTTTASPAGHRFIFTVNSSGVITSYCDGTPVATTTSGGNWASTGTFDLFRMASHDQDFSYMTIAEAGVATGFTNSTDVGLLDTYLKNKWGL